MPIIPLVIYGGAALLGGSAAFGVYQGASETTRAILITAALVGGGYVIFKRVR